jgi:hypothetical protein
VVYEKNGALKSTYYYFGWEELNHFVPLCASFLHFDEPISIDGDALARSKPEDYRVSPGVWPAFCYLRFNLRYDASPPVPRDPVKANDVTSF